MSSTTLELTREGKVKEFSERIMANSSAYSNQGLELVRDLNFSPFAIKKSFVYHLQGATLIMEDNSVLRTSKFCIHCSNGVSPEEIKSRLVRLIEGGK